MKLSNSQKYFLNIFSSVITVYGLTALLCLIAALIIGDDPVLLPLGAAAAACLIAGISYRFLGDTGPAGVHPRISYLTVILSWLALIAITSLIYLHSVEGAKWYDSVFEAAAALTTTGTGRLGMSGLPLSMQLFRSMLNWLGGAGLILIAADCLRTWSFSGRSLISIEIPAGEYIALSSSFRNTCRKIIRIYIILTGVHFILLCLAGMPAITSLMTALSNISTAGIQHIGNGVITHLPAAQKALITLFSFLGSLNLSVFLLLFSSARGRMRRDSETMFYAGRILLTAVIIVIAVLLAGRSYDRSLPGDALMQTVSFLSTSGYIVTDCDAWPEAVRIIIILQMFIGACAVSTGGGIKNARIILGFRSITDGLFMHVHPKAVRHIRLNGETVRYEQFIQANLYITLFMLIYLAGALLLSLDNKNESIVDALNYSQAMLTNTGTSIANAGGYIEFSPLSRLVMSAEMLCGRLEIYPVLMLFFRGFWRSDSSR